MLFFAQKTKNSEFIKLFLKPECLSFMKTLINFQFDILTKEEKGGTTR